VLELRYGGVAGTHRNQGIFTNLVTRVLDRMLPVTASISPANLSSAARILEHHGFRRQSSPGGEQHFRWEPGTGGDQSHE